MKHFQDEWVEEWCNANGWTELFQAEANNYWAFPPGAVIPEPIPTKILKLIKAQKGLTADEQYWCALAVAFTVIGGGMTLWSANPLPLLLAFAFAAVTVAQLEVEFS
ncbi:MAG: hypothetical protein RMK91_04875 [Pseudanabaenaceae cyanobacterium SKYGB_i_bin29]|nr:hypothetical protein [Pseudanabaenaceae cyanobacterium SKYG29]MDW8421179.1 hypothetical protein [Pseudanabaenaceae cyanobacterium SKYGB_i_bin29]